MRRLGPLMAGVAAALAFVSIVGGLGAGAAGGLAGILLGGGVTWLGWSWFSRRRPSAPGGWTQAAAVDFRPAAGHVAAPPSGVALALSRVEVRELTSSAAVGLGIGFSALVMYFFGYLWSADYHGGLVGSFELYPIFTHPLAGLVVLATHRARTRSSRDGTQELFETCPTSQSTRTLGHLLTSWFPAAIAVVFLTLQTAAFTQGVTFVYGHVGARQIAAVLGAVVLCIGATALGVALARWAPWTLVPVAAVIAIGFVTTRLATTGDRLTEPLRQLSTWLNDPDANLRFTAPHWLAHHLWILALVGVVTMLAVLRDQRRPAVIAAGAVFVFAAVGSAVVATRPIDASDARRIAALIDAPEAHQRCVDAAGLPVCAYAGDGGLADHFAKVVAPVVAAAPPGALDGWAVRHGWDVDRSELDPEVRRLLDVDSRDRRVIPISLVGDAAADEGARFWVALTAVGITEDTTRGATLSVTNQARGVIAFWLATRGVDAETATAMTSFDENPGQASSSSDRPWPDGCYAGPAPVTWALTDLDAARALIAAPVGAISELLHRDWDRLTDQATSTDELLVAAGLAPVAPRDGFTRGGQEC